MSTSARLGFLKLILIAILLLANHARAQSYKIIHFFTGLRTAACLQTVPPWMQPAISTGPPLATLDAGACSSYRRSPTARG